MDGNGRWAALRELPRVTGHRQGSEVAKKILRYAYSKDIKIMTLYAFSTENWKRPKSEIEFIFNLFVDTIKELLPELKQKKVKAKIIGERENLPLFLREAIKFIEKETHNFSDFYLNIALNYGGRREILEAFKKMNKAIEKKEMKEKDINENTIKDFLHTKNMEDPDILIRTGGDFRISNFLLYQIAYTELFFTKTLWPDFTEEEFENILNEYSKRERRFGAFSLND